MRYLSDVCGIRTQKENRNTRRRRRLDTHMHHREVNITYRQTVGDGGKQSMLNSAQVHGGRKREKYRNAIVYMFRIV